MTFIEVVRRVISDRSESEENARIIPSAEASMMEGLSAIEGADERRKAVNRMVANAHNYSIRFGAN